jgi:hypothetical protein
MTKSGTNSIEPAEPAIGHVIMYKVNDDVAVEGSAEDQQSQLSVIYVNNNVAVVAIRGRVTSKQRQQRKIGWEGPVSGGGSGRTSRISSTSRTMRTNWRTMHFFCPMIG